MAGSSNDPRHEIPARSDYGHGCYRRTILVEAAAGEVRGELADDFHHFAVRVRHDDAAVCEIDGEPVRVPWTTCPGALTPLRRMEGVALELPLLELLRHSPAREQCTHWHDLACLAIAHAARAARGGPAARRYDFAMPDREGRATTCSLARDEEPCARWHLEGMQIVEADDASFAGLKIGTAPFREHLARITDPEALEAAWVLQRAFFIGLGRQHDFERMPTAEVFGAMVGGSCHTYSPERMASGERIRGTVRDFTDRPGDVLERS